jgi:hypothetical protein
LQCPCLYATHVEQIADQRVEAVGALFNGRQECGLILGGPGDVILAQRADGNLQRSQRCTQVVSDCGQQGRAHPVALGEGFCLAGLNAQSMPFESRCRLGRSNVEYDAADPGRLPARQGAILAGREATALPVPGVPQPDPTGAAAFRSSASTRSDAAR